MSKLILNNTDILMQYISEELLNLGFTPKLKGFNYAREAIYIYLNSSIADYNFKDVLSSIAQKYSITAKSVNSAIKRCYNNIQ